MQQVDEPALPVEDPQTMRRRTISERMAKLGGIKFGSSVDESNSGVAADQEGTREAGMQQVEDPETMRRRTIAERMAKLGGIKFGSSVDDTNSGVAADQDGIREAETQQVYEPASPVEDPETVRRRTIAERRGMATLTRINLSRSMSGKSAIPKASDLEADSVEPPAVVSGRSRGPARNRSAETGRRAFAVWGHDESDSDDASDSDT